MNAINYRVSLDMLDTLSQTTIKAKKGDSACKIHIALVKNGKIFSIGEGCSATFSAKKSDGNFIYDKCTIEGDTIVYDFSSSIDENGVCQVSAIEGNVECETTLYSASGEQLTSPRFTLYIDNVVYNGEEIASSPESDVLRGLIKEAKDLIKNFEGNIDISEEQIGEAIEKYLKEHPIEGGGGENGYTYIPEVIRKSNGEIALCFHAMKDGVEDKDKTFTETIMLPKCENGLTSAQITALDEMFKIAAYTADATEAYTAFKEAFGLSEGGEEPENPDIPVDPDTPIEPTITLVSISATYSGGEVEVGTAVTALTGITVKANYSDGTSKTVTGYTLSGTIGEGNNTITVSYQGKTTTFTVVGVAEEEPDIPPADLGEPVYALANAVEFDGSTGEYDTGYKLFDINKDYSIVFETTVSSVSSDGTIWHCVDGNYQLIFTKKGGYAHGITYCRGANTMGSSGAINNYKMVITRAASENPAVYIVNNGVVKSAKAAKGTNSHPPEGIKATIKFGGNDAVGTMYDFKVYERVLTEAEINAYLGVNE